VKSAQTSKDDATTQPEQSERSVAFLASPKSRRARYGQNEATQSAVTAVSIEHGRFRLLCGVQPILANLVGNNLAELHPIPTGARC
jgi:hypothetical protein